ncbi:MAG: helix-turn-helix transcriptional regulator [Oscillospiraceae bacterium]|nr:helix-turn-helix transcriptional regulator [Oscillospiraceae bacterium]
MAFSYNKLWKLLVDENMTKTSLRKAVGMSSSTLAKMGKGENVPLDVIDKICLLLDCEVEDVIEHIKQTGNAV